MSGDGASAVRNSQKQKFYMLERVLKCGTAALDCATFNEWHRCRVAVN